MGSEESGDRLCIGDLQDESTDRNDPGQNDACSDTNVATCFGDAIPVEKGDLVFTSSVMKVVRKEEVLEMFLFGSVHDFLQTLGSITELTVNILQRTTLKCGVNTLTEII